MNCIFSVVGIKYLFSLTVIHMSFLLVALQWSFFVRRYLNKENLFRWFCVVWQLIFWIVWAAVIFLHLNVNLALIHLTGNNIKTVWNQWLSTHDVQLASFHVISKTMLHLVAALISRHKRGTCMLNTYRKLTFYDLNFFSHFFLMKVKNDKKFYCKASKW